MRNNIIVLKQIENLLQQESNNEAIMLPNYLNNDIEQYLYNNGDCFDCAISELESSINAAEANREITSYIAQKLRQILFNDILMGDANEQ